MTLQHSWLGATADDPNATDDPKEKYTVDVYGDGTQFVTPEDWYESIVPAAAASFVLGDDPQRSFYITKPLNVYLPGRTHKRAWIVIRAADVDAIMEQVQRIEISNEGALTKGKPMIKHE